MGEKNYARFGNEFPLLIKFIDANDDLSIQVHPTDELAQNAAKVVANRNVVFDGVGP